MKILSAAQIREADAYTISHEPVAAIDLMERAATACAGRIAELTSFNSTYFVFCGKGNNGGDGLAIARLLLAMKRDVLVFVIEHSANASADFSINLKKLGDLKAKIHFVKEASEIVIERKENTFIIDALLGTGLNKPVDGILADCITLINNSGIPVISVDVPSGLPCDEKPAGTAIVKAAKTLTFQRPKLSFLLSDSAPYVNDFEILDIGLDEKFIEEQPGHFHFFHPKDAAALLMPRSKFSHKGTYGHALLLAGSAGKTGAAILAAKACLRSGAGLLTVHLPSSCVNSMQATLPEAMVHADEEADVISSLPKDQTFSAIGMGPGVGTAKETGQALKLLIQNASAPLVLDADALNLLADNKTWLAFLPPRTILTPHPKEFDRLCGAHTSGFDRLETAQSFAQKNNIIVVLKGAHTAVVLPDRKVFFNSSGNPALAKGGSGDVLTGMILGLLTQCYDPEKAALLGVFVHGRAADLYVAQKSPQTMLAGDLVELLPRAFLL